MYIQDKIDKYSMLKENVKKAEIEMSRFVDNYIYLPVDGDLVYDFYNKRELLVVGTREKEFILYELEFNQSFGGFWNKESLKGHTKIRSNAWKYAKEIFVKGYCYDLITKKQKNEKCCKCLCRFCRRFN